MHSMAVSASPRGWGGADVCMYEWMFVRIQCITHRIVIACETVTTSAQTLLICELCFVFYNQYELISGVGH